MSPRLLFTVNGLFLAVIGGVQVVFELVGHRFGVGPLGDIFDGSYLTIGWVEAHGQAFLVGLLFLLVARHDPRAYWHRFALALHVLLGGANVYFWDSFVHYGLVPMGIAATAAHAALVVAHAWCLRRFARAVTLPR
ncbi:hypothetical protein Val02_71890 [Virgisporangium aliadipatigenens]|uniref:Uncharacterized protein n=1 Tax=Virgisporangium aliadipatigenens TaxID=741659 RepID=A0A8J3YV58_9ACTN|nr:hypothetical protein [Virgisporangium aliadipatigenens]GIJ50303.1 hypothetical protein Val02_71890 [Virgisporangium aliadipatigenens]